jgi:hypothetical protein
VQQAKTLTSISVRLWSASVDAEIISECGKGFIEMPFSDEDVLDIATAWPKIEYMALPPPHMEINQPSMTSLEALLRLCPNLEVLSMGLDVENGRSVELRSEHVKHLETLPLAKPHPLYELDVCESELKEIEARKFSTN